MKILYITSTDLAGKMGSPGSVRHIMEVADNMSGFGYEVLMLVPWFGKYPHPTKVKIKYVPLINIRFIRAIISEFLFTFYISVYLLFWKPDIVYWRQSYLTIFPVLLSRLFKKKIVAEVNGLTIDEVESEDISYLRKMVVLCFEKFNYKRSDILICVAPHIRDRILKHYHLVADRVKVILNGVNSDKMPLKEIPEAKKEIGLSPDDLVVGFVGHFFPWDGIEFLIEAAPKVLGKVKNVKFVIVGSGKWGDHLPGLAVEKGVGNNFVFTGRVPWEKLYNYVNAFDVATAPYSQAINSQSGRSSLKILEYFACKKPVIASQTEVIPEIIDIEKKELGLIIPAEDAEKLAEALIKLLQDKKLRQK
ncbi:MAG: glycosyltransferase family 4 protein, partial [Chitinispirillia bacterium]